MARITYGSSGGDFADETRKAEQLTAATQTVNQKLEEYRAEQESTAGTDQGSAKTRADVAGATEQLSAALRANIESISAETAALRTNTAQLERQLTLRRELAATGGRGGGGGGIIPPVAYAAGGPEEDPANLRAQLAARERQIAQLSRQGSVAGVPIIGGPGSAAERAAAVAPSLETTAARKEAEAYFQQVAKNEQAIGQMGARQASANAEFQASAAAYASSSDALSRHGALTTEFIQALARGQVTMGEFGSQMVSTIGKFGGWIAAGAAVYGVVKLFGDLTKGATETQTAVSQLGRFIPGLGGPAGGGSGQIAPFEGQLRGISTQFNVPISEVTDSMLVMARSFHNVTDAANATRAALAVQILDQVSGSQTETYLTGIANSLGYSNQPGGGNRLIGVVNSLNELQSQYNARVSQVLPGVARAVPAAIASGTSINQLEALTALGVRSGIPGNQVGTALLRSMTGFAFRPGSEVTYGRFGIQAEPGQYGNLIEQIMGTISGRARAGNPLSRGDLTALASALGGPQLGARTLLPLLVQQSSHPNENFYQNVLTATQHPRSYQEDLNAYLDTVGQRFKSIGILLQNFGSQLAESGALQPLISMLSIFRDLASAATNTLGPITRLLGFFNVLPGFVQQLAGAAAVFAAVRWASTSTRFGGAATAAISRLPGLGGLYNDSRAEVEGAVGRYQTYTLPLQEQELNAARVARLRASSASVQAGDAFAAYAATGVATSDPHLTTLREKQEAASAALTTASERESQAAQAVAQTQADIEVLKNKQLDWSTRATYLEQRGAVSSEELVGLKQQLVEQAYAQLSAGRGVTAAATGALATSLGAAGAAGASEFAAARSVGFDPTALAGFGIAGVAGVAGTRTLIEARASLARRVAAESSLGQGIAFTPESVRAGLAVPLSNAVTPAVEEQVAAVQASLRQRIASRFGALAGGPALPLAGALVSQSIPGYVGQVAQSGFSDMLLASFIPGLGAGGRLAAFALGGATTPLTNGSSGSQQFLSRALGAGAGAYLGSKALPLLARGATSLLSALPESLLPFDVAAPEIGIPLTIAATVGGALLGGIFGGGSSQQQPPPQPTAWNQNQDALGALHAVIYGGAKGRAAFGSNVSNLLADAYLNTGASAQRSQQSAAAIVNTLTAQLGLYGSNTVEGKAAQTGLSEFMQSVGENARLNPQLTQQLMSTLTQSSNAEIQRRFQFAVSQGGGSASGAAADAIARTQQTNVQPLQDALASQQGLAATAQETLSSLQGRAAGATGKQKQELEKQIAAQRELLGKAQGNVQTLQAMTQLARENATLQEQQYAQQALQAEQTSIQAAGQLKVAQAGGNQALQAQAQATTANKSLQAVKDSHLTGRARTDALNQAQAAADQAHTAVVTQGLNAVQAASAVAEASTPIGNTAADAEAKAKAAYAAWNYMSQHSHSFDPNQIKTAWAAVLQARKDAITAVADYAIQMNDLATSLTQAQDYGDSLAAAQAGLSGAERDLSLAKTPQQAAQARVNVANQQAAVYQAQQQRYQEYGQLAASQLPGDPVGQAAALAQAAAVALANAHGTDNIITAQTNYNNAQKAYYDAITQQQDMLYQTAQINETGNAVLQAATAEAQAAYDASRAQGPGEAAKAAQEAAQAAQQAHQAAQQRIQETTALAQARDVYNPVEAAKRALAGINAEIANAQGRPDELLQLEAQRAQAEYQLHQARQARISQHGATREAQQSGNTVASAETAVDTARQLLATARGTQEQQQAEAQLATAEHQLTQARIARAQALAQLQETQDTGNVVAQAQDALAAANRERELAKGRDATIKARTDQAAARQQEIQAEQTRAQEYGQLAVAQAGNDPVAAAQAQLRAAAKELELAHGIDQKIQAETAYAQAQNALVVALDNEIVSLGQLAAARDWADPLKAIQDQINAVIKALANAKTPAQKIQYETQLAQLQAQYQQAFTSQREATIQFQLTMRQITAQQAILQLEDLLKTQKMTEASRQQIEEQIRQLQLGNGTSEFNLAPGKIKLPTIYDIVRAMQGHSPIGNSAALINNQPTINVYVGQASDAGAVYDAIDRATGSGLASTMRSVGA
jgi:hypothetical protein